VGLEDPAIARAAEVAAIGLRSRTTPADLDTLTRSIGDADPRVRAAAIAALARTDATTETLRAWQRVVHDPDASVRRRAAEVAPRLGREAAPEALARTLASLLDDADATVIEATAWALGEIGVVDTGALQALAHVATGHDDPIAREAAVAALGALGDPRGLDAILAACRDKPAVRRRAVLALAPFDGPAVSAALAAALDDRDWQVRQAAEDLMSAGREED
jgi:HEAT repeat protein